MQLKMCFDIDNTIYTIEVPLHTYTHVYTHKTKYVSPELMAHFI